MNPHEANSRAYDDLTITRLRLALHHVSASNRELSAAARTPNRRSTDWSGWSLIPSEFVVLIASALVFGGMFYSMNGSLRPLLRTVEGLFGH